ncbi:related to U3 small nucleolar ribonucleoprotein protein LCP5 [Zygosaccharomyces bailii ISA1307]|nr:related to U3 small nucleolar ribonucleoprotein protein LCP5 [Zygosaccharomyces bailii ISA1307]
MTELDEVLRNVCESLVETSSSVEKLKSNFEASNLASNDKVSLMSLKAASMLAYINALMMVIGEKLGGDCLAEAGREKSIEHRVVLERGVKPLEKKLSYQLDKLARAHERMQKEYAEAEKRVVVQETVNEKEDSDSSDDEMAQRPHTFGGKQREVKKDDDVYRPPKINSALPMQDRFNIQSHKDRSNRLRMQAMDEYLREESERPEWESFIGSNILNHGRGGVKSLRDSDKDRRVTEYEEDNFTRLKAISKTDKRNEKRKERMNQINMIGGEDFSIFGSKRKIEESTSRGSKRSRNAWERAKKKL